MAKRESEVRRAPETDETVNKAYKAGTQLQGGKLSGMKQIHLFDDVNIRRTQEGGFVDFDDPYAYQSGEWIPHRTQHTLPMTEEHILRKLFRIQKKEAECGYPTVKGSLSARAQSAAAANVREHKVESDAGLSATLR